MKKVFLFFMIAFPLMLLSCGTKQGMIVADKERNQKDFNFSNYGSSIDITEQYKLDYHFSSTFAPNKMNVMWKQADVIDKRTNDTVRVEMENFRYNVICNNPLIYAGAFEIKHLNQYYIIQFLYDFRTYLNKKKNELKPLEKCYNVADLDPKMLEKF